MATKRKSQVQKGKTVIKKKQKLTPEQELLSLLSLTNWKLSNDIEQRAFTKAFPNKEERLEFMQNLLLYKKLIASLYAEVETNLPRNRKNPNYYAAREFKEKVMNEPKKGNEFSISRVDDLIQELEDEIEESEEEQVKEPKESEELNKELEKE